MTRVQLISSGIPAYQNDFSDSDEALRTAAALALGAKALSVPVLSGELARYAGPACARAGACG